MEYLKIKNWEKFQHYKNRCPPWIKLHVRLLNKRDFTMLPVASKCLLMQLWILGSENEGQVPCDIEEIKYRLRDSSIKQDHLNLLIKRGFLLNSNHMLADASTIQADASPETETETETEEKQPTPKKWRALCETLNDICKKINIPKFNPWAFITKNQNSHPLAIEKVLEGLLKNHKDKDGKLIIKNGWAYANKILEIENQNFNERDAIIAHQELKAAFAELANEVS